MNQLRDAVCETITVGSGGRANGRERARLCRESHKRRGHILDVLQSAGLGLRIVKEKVRGEGHFPHLFLFFFCTFSPAFFSLLYLISFSLFICWGVFFWVFFPFLLFFFSFFFSLLPDAPSRAEGSFPRGAGGGRWRPLGGERRVQRCAAPAVGVRRRAALMTNTLGRRGHRAAFLPRGRERPAGAPRAAAVPAPGGKAGTRTHQVSGSVSSRIPLFLSPRCSPVPSPTLCFSPPSLL